MTIYRLTSAYKIVIAVREETVAWKVWVGFYLFEIGKYLQWWTKQTKP